MPDPNTPEGRADIVEQCEDGWANCGNDPVSIKAWTDALDEAKASQRKHGDPR